MFLCILAAPALLIILRYLGQINLSWVSAIVLSAFCAAACMIPAVCKVARTGSIHTRYCVVACSLVIALILYYTFDKVVLAICFFPLIISCVYTDIKLIKWSIGLTVFGIAAVEAAKYLLSFSGFTGNALIVYTLIAMQVVLFAVIIGKTAKSTNKMLNNVQSLYDNIDALITNAAITSDGLRTTESSFLTEIGNSNLDRGQIVNEPDYEPTDGTSILESVKSNVDASLANTKELLKYNRLLAEVSKDNTQLMKDAAKEIKELEHYAERSKAAIESLISNAGKVKEAVTLMSVIADGSCFISMNASLEAARAAEKEGDTSLHLDIKELADRCTDSAFNAKATLKDIVADADAAVKSVSDTYSAVVHSLDMINRTVETLIKGLMLKKMH